MCACVRVCACVCVIAFGSLSSTPLLRLPREVFVENTQFFLRVCFHSRVGVTMHVYARRKTSSQERPLCMWVSCVKERTLRLRLRVRDSLHSHTQLNVLLACICDNLSLVEMALHALFCVTSTFPPLQTQKFHSSLDVKHLNCHEFFRYLAWCKMRFSHFTGCAILLC